jgi:hypothetical protein
VAPCYKQKRQGAVINQTFPLDSAYNIAAAPVGIFSLFTAPVFNAFSALGSKFQVGSVVAGSGRGRNAYLDYLVWIRAAAAEGSEALPATTLFSPKPAPG